MTSRAVAAAEVARAIWARAADDTSSPEEAAAAAERVCTQLRDGLSRWIGTAGFRALLSRALRMLQPEHPALGGLRLLGEADPNPSGTAGRVDKMGPSGAAETGAGMMALMATLIELLGRIIGEELAVHLVEQAGLPGPRLVVTERKRARNG